MQSRQLVYLLAIVAILVAVFSAAAVAAPGASPAHQEDSPETLIEQGAALDSQQKKASAAPAAVSASSLAAGSVYPLFMGVDDSTVPAYTMDPTTNISATAFIGAQVWGAAYDPVNDKVYFNNGSTLYEWRVGGTFNILGTIADTGGATQSMVGLAFYNGVLYGTKNVANEAIWAIDTNTLVATVFIDYVDADFDLGGFAADPNTGEFYATNDDTTPFGSGLFRINPDGTGDLITPYPAGETDIDGLAISDDGKAYMIIDEPGAIYVYDLVAGAYIAPLINPWTTSEVFSGGAYIYALNPSIVMSKTVGIDPDVCAATDNIAVEAGTDVYYCYEVTNTGNVALPLHDLDDDQLGPLLNNFAFNLLPGATVFITDTTTVASSVTNTAVWTGKNNTSVSALFTDTATVNVVNPSIVMSKTVGLDPAICATTNSITVEEGTDVYYCYTVTNTGDVALPLHDLVDDELGALLDDFAFNLAPGATVTTVDAGAVISVTAASSVVNTAVWTGFVDANITASYTDTATVTVTPKTKSFTLTVVKTGAGGGNVTSTPAGVNCITSCSQNYVGGAVVTLKAEADSDSTFTGWSGAGCSGAGDCVVTMDASKSVTARFVKKVYDLYLPSVSRRSAP